MKPKASLSILLLFICLSNTAQSFNGVYAIGKTTFKVRCLSEQDRENGLFNILYAKGDTIGTMASISAYDKYEFAFDEFIGDIYLGTFYFTKAWKGKPLEGFYIRAKQKKKLPVKFIRE